MTPDALAQIWPATFERSYPVWGKEVTLKALDNPVVQEINVRVAAEPEARRANALAVFTVAASLVSIGKQKLCDVESGADFPMDERVAAVSVWDDPVIWHIYGRYQKLCAEHEAVLNELADPNS